MPFQEVLLRIDDEVDYLNNPADFSALAQYNPAFILQVLM